MLVADSPSRTSGNPALDRWPGPYGGVPPFDQIQVADLAPALQAAIAEHCLELETIASDPGEPTFENTILALERAGAAFSRVTRLLEIYTSTHATDEVQDLNTETAPVIAAHRDAIVQNSRLFHRIEVLHAHRHQLGLDPEDLSLLSHYYCDYIQAGAALSSEDKLALTQINQELASLSATFNQNLKAEENQTWVELHTEEDFAGLSESLRQAYRTAAIEHGCAAPGIVLNTRSAVEPFLENSQCRALREKVWTAFVRRGDGGNQYDNNSIVRSILALRAQKARLLKYPSFAHWSLEDSMAETPANALDLMLRMWPAARQRALEEIGQMQRISDAEANAAQRPREPVAAWDYRFYAEKVRRSAYAFDASEAREYLQLHLLLEGLFWLAGELFDYHFKAVPASCVPRLHADVQVFEVRSGDGELLGLWYLDPLARAEKVSGAWMYEYRTQETSPCGERVLPLTAAVTNFLAGPPDEPVLLSWEDARTLIHEFGHSIHGLSSRVRHASLAGIAVASDFVEFPSQLFEFFLGTPQLLQRFARHYRTGVPMPPELVTKIRQSEQFNQGFIMVEYLASAILDMRLHLAAEALDPAQEESRMLQELGMPSQIALRFRAPQFGHVFSEDGYAAGYYGYLWAEALSADAWEGFQDSEQCWRDLAQRLQAEILTVGATRDPAQAYRAFRGRDPDPAALIRLRGLPVDQTVRA